MADRGRVGSLVWSSKSCAEKQWRKAHEGHRSRVSQVKPATDMSAPHTMHMDHFRTNLKKERLLEERYMEIDRENRVLLRKMGEAMNKPNPYTTSGKANLPTSLNRTGRKMDLIRITQENQRMLKSIQQVQPVYSRKKWEAFYKNSETHMKNCCAYPIVTRMTRNQSSPSVLMSIGSDDLQRSDGFASNASASPKRGDEDDRKFVLKEGLRIGQTYYLLEMATDGRTLTVSAYDGETKTSLELVVKEKVHRQLYRQCNGDYAQIAAMLRVQGNRLVIDSPLGEN
eukprot:TRINITY_DN38975_c0_g1_i1.p1 TRINITY_DN38975_c0_g1~~TRINITY_DN38975_c0_g1_i1.p1  ORF type:complete len:284 (-),score=46.38 TRINITY_DN38975_c0_g1_i1:70-921(-)